MKATPLRSPAIDAVLTMCAGVPWSRMIGTKVCTPCTTPQKLTPTTHRQSSRVWSLIRLNVETPALLHNTSTRPNRSSVVAASRSTSAASDVHLDGESDATRALDTLRDDIRRAVVEVGDHDR